jgi:hypothetical protein
MAREGPAPYSSMTRFASRNIVLCFHRWNVKHNFGAYLTYGSIRGITITCPPVRRTLVTAYHAVQ